MSNPSPSNFQLTNCDDVGDSGAEPSSRRGGSRLKVGATSSPASSCDGLNVNVRRVPPLPVPRVNLKPRRLSLRSWKRSTRCSPLPGSASPANCAARSPAPTSSRMSWARCAELPQRQILALASMALRWAAAAMHEAFKGFRRLKAKKHLPALRAALAKQGQQPPSDEALVQIAEAA